MLSTKPWKAEAVILLGFGCLLCLTLGMVLGQVARPFLPERWVQDDQFFVFVLNTLFFHGTALLLTHFFLRTHGVGWKEFLGLDRPGVGRALWRGAWVAAVALPVALALNKLSQWLLTKVVSSPELQLPVRVLQESVGWERRAMFAVTAIGLAPLVEEMIFRGVLYPTIKQQGYPRTAVWATSILFAAIHSNLMTFVPLTLLAMVLIWVYEKSDTLVAPIVTHACFNAANFVLLIYESEFNAWLERISERFGG